MSECNQCKSCEIRALFRSDTFKQVVSRGKSNVWDAFVTRSQSHTTQAHEFELIRVQARVCIGMPDLIDDLQ